MNRLHRLALSSLFLLLILSGCASHLDAPRLAKASLPRLIAERLSWMDEVARFKQAKSLPVNDPKREADLLVAMRKLGAEAGIPEAATTAFFKGQMEAAKTRQEEWLATHSAASQQGRPVPDLTKNIRPALDQIGKRMIQRLAEARRLKDSSDLIQITRQTLARRGYSQAVASQALQGLEAGLK